MHMPPSFRDHLLLAGLAPRSVSVYLSAVRCAESWCDRNGYTLATLSPSAVVEYASTKPLTWSARKLVRNSLSHYWRFVKRRRPPIAAILVPKKPRMRCRALDDDDARLLAKACRSDGTERGLAVAFGLYLALRRAEIAALRWADFDDGWLTLCGKGMVTASLPVHPVVAELLAEHSSPTPFLFPGTWDGHVCPTTIWTWVTAIADTAGIGKVNVHQLRHTALATANDNTGDLRAVQTFARHARPETTSGYTRTTASRLTAVVHSLDY